MSRPIERLKAVTVAKARKPGLLADGGGLYLRVGPTGAKSWIFRYRRDGRLHDMGLGPVHTVSLLEARNAAQECRKLRLKRLDPIEARRAGDAEARIAAASAISFRECADSYIASHQAGWRNRRHAAQWPSTLEAYVYPVFGNLPVQGIDVGLVMKALEPIWNTKPETASRVRGRIESILDWATARGYRKGENPARWRGHLENLVPRRDKVSRVRHLAALPYNQIGAFMAELRLEESVAARALEFAILTATRTGEVIGARWSEINRAEKLWIVPGERMKAGREHRIPLSDAALAIVDQMAKALQGEFIFPGQKALGPLNEVALLRTLRRMGHDDLTVHGFRSSFRDWAAERTNFPADVAEMALAHTVGDKVEAAYRRSDLFARRRALMACWAEHCANAPGRVVRLQPAR